MPRRHDRAISGRVPASSRWRHPRVGTTSAGSTAASATRTRPAARVRSRRAPTPPRLRPPAGGRDGARSAPRTRGVTAGNGRRSRSVTGQGVKTFGLPVPLRWRLASPGLVSFLDAHLLRPDGIEDSVRGRIRFDAVVQCSGLVQIEQCRVRAVADPNVVTDERGTPGARLTVARLVWSVSTFTLTPWPGVTPSPTFSWSAVAIFLASDSSIGTVPFLEARAQR